MRGVGVEGVGISVCCFSGAVGLGGAPLMKVVINRCDSRELSQDPRILYVHDHSGNDN